MYAKRLFLIVGLTLIIVLGIKQFSTTRHGLPASTSATTSAPLAPEPPRATHAAGAIESAQTTPTNKPEAASTIKQINEDGSETIEDTSGDNGTHNALLAAVASTAAAATTSTATPWIEGTNYTRLVPAQPTSVAAGQVEVLEFFWYACPHCYAIDAQVESWIKSKPSYISFTRVPVLWNEGHRSLARLFYALDSMGKLGQLHSDIFKAIHVNGNMLVAKDASDAAGSEQIQTQFVKKFGISESDFKTAYHSFSVETNMQKADQLVQRYRIAGVPTFVVNGKFVADVGTAQSPERLLALVNDLATGEHKH